MEKFLASIFKTLPFPCYLTHRLNEDKRCMVYDFIENNLGSSDDEEEVTGYTVIMRLYGTANDMINNKKILKDLLRENNFEKIVIPPQIYDDSLKIYQQALQYEVIFDE